MIESNSLRRRAEWGGAAIGNRRTLRRRAAHRLGETFPELGPWARAALWHGLSREPLPAEPLDAELPLLRQQKLTPLLLGLIRDRDVHVADEARRFVQTSDFDWSLLTSEVVNRSRDVLRWLNASGVSYAISKGPGIAAWYPSPRERPYSDLDILVAPADIDFVVTGLRERGYSEEQRSRQPRDYFDRWCREGVNLRSPAGGSVDAHHHLPPWYWSRGLSLPTMIQRAVPVPVGGQVVPCLDTADNLLVAALHVISDRNSPGRTLIVWRDLAQLAAVADPVEVARRASDARLSAWLRAVLGALPEQVRPVRLLALLPDDAHDLSGAARLQLLLSERLPRRSVLVSQFLRLPLPGGLALVAGFAMPSRRFLTEKFPSEAHPYRRWWTGAND